MSLTIQTASGQTHTFELPALRAFPAACQIDDISTMFPRRKGRGLRLACLIDAVLSDQEQVAAVTLKSSHDGFEKRIDYALISAHAVLVYEQDGQPLPETAGGPFRLLTPGTTVCGSAELDHCVNVKFLDEIQLTLNPRNA